MNTREFLLLFIIVLVGSTLANLIALKIAADQIQREADASPLGKLLKNL